MKKKLFVSVFVGLGLAACSKTENPDQYWTQYQQLANQLQQTIQSAPLKQIEQDAVALTELSTRLLPDFVVKQPVCAEYIQAAVDASDTMLGLSLVQIERDYHADGKLPAMQNPLCYHAKDLLVHPATVAVIAKKLPDSEQTREQLQDELEEVLEHFAEVKRDAGL